MIIPVSDQGIPDLDRVLFSIPATARENYRVVEIGKNVFKVYFGGELVAMVKTSNSLAFKFTFFDNTLGLNFKRLMEKEYFPKPSDNDLLWIVLLRVESDCWSFVGKPESSEAEALAWVNDDTLECVAILVSYLPSDNLKSVLVAQSSRILSDSWPSTNALPEELARNTFCLYKEIAPC
jgi:hypothetical protein